MRARMPCSIRAGGAAAVRERMRSSVADCRSATSSASSPSRRIALVTRRSGPRKIQSPRPPLPPATNAATFARPCLFDVGLEAKVDPRQLLDPPGCESFEVEVVVEQLRWAVRHRRARRGEQDSLAVDGRGEIPEAEVVDRAQVVDPLGHGERDDAGGKRRRDHETAPGDRQAARRDEDVEGRLGGSQVPAEEACGRGHQREEEDGDGEPERERDARSEAWLGPATPDPRARARAARAPRRCRRA